MMETMSSEVRQEKQPASEEILEIAPGVLRLQLTIAFPGLGHVNCYAMQDSQGITLVDPGLPGVAPWRELTKRLEAAQLPLRRIHTVVITHSHPDHFGAAERLREVTGADIVTHDHFKTWFDPAEEDDNEKDLADRGDLDTWAIAKERLMRWGHLAIDGQRGAHWHQPTPWGGAHPRPDRKTRLRYRTQGLVMRRFFKPPVPSRRVLDGAVLAIGGREWVAVHTPGHTVDHLCLLDPADGTLISGDHVLPTITPHISGLVLADDPLALYLTSLDNVGQIQGVRTVLPAHGQPFDDLSGRTKAIKEHHLERLATLRHAAGDLGDASVESYTQRLFKPTSWGPMADSETYAHLEHLRHLGQARRHKVGRSLFYEVEAETLPTRTATSTEPAA